MNIRRIKQSNEKLNELLSEDLVLNESPIVYGEDLGTYKDVKQGLGVLGASKTGMVKINQFLIINQQVTKQEIDDNLYPPIMKDVYVDKRLPIVLVWGEPDIKRGSKQLEGHGLSHIIQGHRRDLPKIVQMLNEVLNKKLKAKPDRYGNYTISYKDFRFSFAIKDNDRLGRHAVLVTGYKLS